MERQFLFTTVIYLAKGVNFKNFDITIVAFHSKFKISKIQIFDLKY